MEVKCAKTVRDISLEMTDWRLKEVYHKWGEYMDTGVHIYILYKYKCEAFMNNAQITHVFSGHAWR